jgi:low affinity Fe/Cu permease
MSSGLRREKWMQFFSSRRVAMLGYGLAAVVSLIGILVVALGGGRWSFLFLVAGALLVVHGSVCLARR